MRLRALGAIMACIVLLAAGCAGAPVPARLPQPESENTRLKKLLALREAQLEEKEAEIKRLRRQLESFGVFE